MDFASIRSCVFLMQCAGKARRQFRSCRMMAAWIALASLAGFASAQTVTLTYPLNATQLIFGGQLLNSVSQAQTVVFTNTGSVPVAIDSVTASANFSYTTNCSSSVAAGASCSVNVLFAPTSAGALSGSIAIVDSVGSQTIPAQGEGINPGLSVSPSFALFGAQVVGATSPAQTVTATNTGTVALNLNPVQVTGDFSESNQCPATLQPGASCFLSLTFSPTAAGTLSGSLVVSDSAGVVSTLVAVSGQGTQPGVAATPATLSFGSLPVGTASQAQTVTVANTGTASLQIGSVIGTGDFAETDTCANQTIAPGSYCVINVTMTPTTLGPRTGSIQINANGSIQQLSLEGGGSPAGLTLTPPVLNFGAQTVGVTSKPLTATLTNNIGAAIDGLLVVPSGEFGESDNCSSTLANNASCTLSVTVTPAISGIITGSIEVTGTQSNSDTQNGFSGLPGSSSGIFQTLPTSGAMEGSADFSLAVVAVSASANLPGISFSASTLSFPSTLVGATSASQTITITNTNAALPLTHLTVSENNATEFPFLFDCPETLSAQASCTVTISFMPAETGTRSGTLNITADGGIAAAIPESGAAIVPIDFTLSASNASQTVQLGGTAQCTLSITPSSGTSFPNPVILTLTGVPSGVTVTVSPTAWTQLTSTTWQLPANTTLTDLSLTFNIPSQTSGLHRMEALPRGILPLLCGVLWLPLACKWRRAGRRLGKAICLLLLLAVSAVTLTGCGISLNFLNQTQTSNNTTVIVTVNVTSGAISHSTNLTFTVE
jgi:hypothetical protein